MISIHERRQKTHNIVFILFIVFIQVCQEAYLRLGLHEKWLLTLDDFDCHFLIGVRVFCFDYLAKRTFSYSPLELISTIVNVLVGS